MKKTVNLFLILSVLVPSLVLPNDIGAKTLRDLRNELDKMEAEYKNNVEKKKLTEAQIRNIHSSINNIGVEIDNMQKKINDLSNEIVVLNENIESKDKEIKDIVNFVQVSNGESAYLEYAFGAQSFTDFIYRMAISEQLAKYNQSLMSEYNKMIDNNNKKVKEMNSRTVDLNKKQVNLSGEIKKLGSHLSELIDVNISVEEEIKLQRNAIKLYQDMGCKLDENIKTCGRDKLPPGTAFFRPVVVGKIGGPRSEFGYRVHPTSGKWQLHAAVDIGTNYSTNVPIYSSGDGMVIAVTKRSSCGGNMVYVHHNIKGKYYTTMYAHLQRIDVEPKQVVTRNTQIGIMGGSPSLTPWDKCTTGLHLHFQIANGLYLKDYKSFAEFTARSFDPRKIVNFPGGTKWFTDRMVKY